MLMPWECVKCGGNQKRYSQRISQGTPLLSGVTSSLLSPVAPVRFNRSEPVGDGTEWLVCGLRGFEGCAGSEAKVIHSRQTTGQVHKVELRRDCFLILQHRFIAIGVPGGRGDGLLGQEDGEDGVGATGHSVHVGASHSARHRSTVQAPVEAREHTATSLLHVSECVVWELLFRVRGSLGSEWSIVDRGQSVKCGGAKMGDRNYPIMSSLLRTVCSVTPAT